MIDPYSLINSKSIADYCRSIKHQFNTLEIGILIYRCKHITLEKKMEHYNEILNNPELYPDGEVSCHLIKYGITALDLIKMEIDMLRSSLALFNKQEKNTVFTLEGFFCISSEEGNVWCDSGVIFKTLKNVNDYIEKEMITSDDREYKIIKKYLNKDNFIALTYRKNNTNSFELFDIIDCSKQSPFEENSRIGECWIDVPTPFKRGDIVTNGKKIGVLTHLYSSCKADESDMISGCYFYHKKHRQIEWDDSFAYYDEIEYFTEELKGIDRIIKAISSLMTTSHEVEPDLFLDAYNYFKAEEMVNIEKYLLSDYTDEGLELVGLNKEDCV